MLRYSGISAKDRPERDLKEAQIVRVPARGAKAVSHIAASSYNVRMAKQNAHSKPLTVAEMAAMGGRAQKEKYSTEQLSAWGRKGGWPKGKPRKPKKEDSE